MQARCMAGKPTMTAASIGVPLPTITDGMRVPARAPHTPLFRTGHTIAATSSSNGNGKVAVTDVRLLSPAGPLEAGEALAFSPEQVFTCPEESLFYSQCLQKALGGSMGLLSAAGDAASVPTVVEFGAGDGSPVIDALTKMGSQFRGVVHGYELNPRAAGLARARATQARLSASYQVHTSCFFEGAQQLRASAACLVANPPYIPAPDNDILMPELHGGVDGGALTNQLLDLGYPSAMLLVSSFSNPLHTIQHARDLGYSVTDFLITPLPFGYYSSELKVKNWIRKMRSKGQAFFTERGDGSGWYLLAGVMFQKVAPPKPANNINSNGCGCPAQASASCAKSSACAADELIRVMTALR